MEDRGLRFSIFDLPSSSITGGTNMAGPGACYTGGDLEGKKKDSIYHQVKEFLDKGETLAVATIVSAKGSTRREGGAKVVDTAGGETSGDLGGGCAEAGAEGG